MGKRIKLKVLGFYLNKVNSKLFNLVMASEDGKKRMVIMTAMTEAQSIAFKLQNISPLYPFLHDLVGHLLYDFSINLVEVNIYKHDGEIFFSRMLFDQFGKEIEAATVDAICIALRTKSPIYISEEILNKLAVDLKDEELDVMETDDQNVIFGNLPQQLSTKVLSESDLQILLHDAVLDEDYEVAAAIRDELKRRRKA